MYEDIESIAPVAGNTMPSSRKGGYSRGTDIDSIFRSMEQEDLLRYVSTYPEHQRKMMLKILRGKSRNRE